MSERDDDMHVRLGRIRDRRIGKPKPFVHQVLRAAKKSGSGEVGGRRLAGSGRSGFGRGRTAFSRSRLFRPQRRVILKARIVRGGSRGARSAPLTAHLSYLKRDGVTRDGAPGRTFDATGDDADGKAFAERCGDDRHHFRFIISPEDAGEMSDLHAFTRDLVSQMEADLGTWLDWIAIDHWNTDNPHVHLLVRGVAENGRDLVIARDYISRGLRSRAEEGGWITAATRHFVCRGQDRPAGGCDSFGSHLRGRLRRFFLWVPTGTRSARCAGRSSRRHSQETSELGA